MKIGKLGKRMVLAIAVAIAAIVVVTLIVCFVCPWYANPIYWIQSIHQAQQRRVLLLCKTDHQALLKAGREILSHESVKKRLRDGHGIAGDFHIPREMQIPQAILVLQPRTVLISYSGYLIIEMHGGMDHFGVRIYPEGVNEPHPLFHGGRKLLEGLVYYDEGYSSNPEYDKRIEALLQKRK